jgi:hypothetical protein
MEIKTVKKGVKAVASIGIGIIVNNIIKSTTPSTIGIIGKICVFVGGWVIGGVLCDKADKYVDGAIDTTVTNVKEVMAELR